MTIGEFWTTVEQLQKINEILKIKLQKCENACRNLAEFLNSQRRLPEAFFLVSRLDSKDPKECKSCRSRQELSYEYPNSYEYSVFTCKNRLRYRRERASQSLPKNSQKLETKLEQNRINIDICATTAIVAKIGGNSWGRAWLARMQGRSQRFRITLMLPSQKINYCK